MNFFASKLDAHGEPSALSIIRKWRAQKLEDDEQNLLQERLFNAEDHFRRMCAEGTVANMEAEAHYRRMKNARAELVCCFQQFFSFSCSHAYSLFRAPVPGSRPHGLCATRLRRTIV